MNAGSSLAVAVAILVAPMAVSAQPQKMPPKDPATPLPSYSLESLWQEIDCDCACDCCERIKSLIKKRLKDPRRRPQMGAEPREVKPRRQRDAQRRAKRIRHPRGTESMWDRPWPRSGDRWLDAARSHRYRKSLRRNRSDGLGLSDEQRDAIEELRYRRRVERIDLEAALKKEELELKRLMGGGEVDEGALRERVDAMAKIRAELEFNRLMTRIEWRRQLTDDQMERLERRRR